MPTHTDRVDLVRELWPNDDFTAKLGPDDLHTAGRAIGNSQRRDQDRLPRSSAAFASGAIGRPWSR